MKATLLLGRLYTGLTSVTIGATSSFTGSDTGSEAVSSAAGAGSSAVSCITVFSAAVSSAGVFTSAGAASTGAVSTAAAVSAEFASAEADSPETTASLTGLSSAFSDFVAVDFFVVFLFDAVDLFLGAEALLAGFSDSEAASAIGSADFFAADSLTGAASAAEIFT